MESCWSCLQICGWPRYSLEFRPNCFLVILRSLRSFSFLLWASPLAKSKPSLCPGAAQGCPCIECHARSRRSFFPVSCAALQCSWALGLGVRLLRLLATELYKCAVPFLYTFYFLSGYWNDFSFEFYRIKNELLPFHHKCILLHDQFCFFD